MKKFILFVFAAILGGFFTLELNKYLNPGSNNNPGMANARPVNYDIKTVTVPTFDFADVSELVTPTVVHIKTKIEEISNNACND